MRDNIFSGRNQATFFCFAWVQELTRETQSLTKYGSTLCGRGLGPGCTFENSCGIYTRETYIIDMTCMSS